MPMKVLVCDDERHVVRLIQVNLERQGYAVVTAFGGRECLDKISSERPDIVVLDVLMPDMNGFEVLRLIRQNAETENLPVVMLRAKAQDKGVFERYEYGADLYLTKPFNPTELISFLLGRPPKPKPGVKPKKILVCDDERQTVNSIQSELEQSGYEVVALSDARLVLETARRERPDFVVLDVMMPYADGYALRNDIRSTVGLANMPVVLLTAQAQETYVYQAGENEVDFFLVKPVDPVELRLFLKLYFNH